ILFAGFSAANSPGVATNPISRFQDADLIAEVNQLIRGRAAAGARTNYDDLGAVTAAIQCRWLGEAVHSVLAPCIEHVQYAGRAHRCTCQMQKSPASER